MSSRQSNYQDDSEEVFMNDSVDFLDDDVEAEEDQQEERGLQSKAVNTDIRHRIEERLEQKRLLRELEDYDFLDLDDDTLH